ncbi:MAG: polyhydroxyalkanoate synthesis repressor PhaR [Hydrogenophilales bacterium]|nr:polyhydroxyalkanoate synthesis repressor PhaR [Hydrogenophilales bacterium]
MIQERIIKKYPNRRLYDTEESRYITLAEVKDLVMSGIEFKVIDSQTEQELTRSILLQIIMEQEAGGHPIFTSPMLSRFIRFYGDAAQATLSTFLEQGLDFFLKQQGMVNQQVNGMFGVPNPMEFWMKLGQQNMNYWTQMEEFYRHSGGVKPNENKPK